MGLPPIIANLPIIRLFRSESSSADSEAKEKRKLSAPQDIVDISSRALASEDEARDAALQTRNILESDPESFLGLDPAFS